MRLEINVELDEYPCFRAVRVGQWSHWYEYSTGEGTWTYRPASEFSTLADDCKTLPFLDGGKDTGEKPEQHSNALVGDTL